jgi:hypothetical protein
MRVFAAVANTRIPVAHLLDNRLPACERHLFLRITD